MKKPTAADMLARKRILVNALETAYLQAEALAPHDAMAKHAMQRIKPIYSDACLMYVGDDNYDAKKDS